MNNYNGGGHICLEGYALQRDPRPGIFSAMIKLGKSAAELHQLAAHLHNTGTPLEQMLSGLIILYGDGRARLAIPNHKNGSGTFEYLNLDSHETGVLARILRDIGAERIENYYGYTYPREAQNRLQEFIALHI